MILEKSINNTKEYEQTNIIDFIYYCHSKIHSLRGFLRL